MSATGKDTTSSTPQFIAALVTGAVVVGALSALFVVLHRKYKHVYQSRLELAPPDKKPPVLPTGIISWWKTVLSTPDELIIEMNGLDAYLFVRFLKVFGVWMLIPYFLLTCIILIPVDAASPNAGKTGLNKLTFGNVAPAQSNRHIAHLLVALVLIAWTIYLIFREYVHLMKVRQAWLASQTHQRLARTRTVMLVNVPEDLMSGSALEELSTTISTRSSTGSRTKVWLARKVGDMEKIFDDRNDECSRLEAGEAKLLAKVSKNVKKGKTPSNPPAGQSNSPMETERAGSDAIIDKYLTPKEKGKISWKQGPLGLIGKKMDRQQSPAFIREKNSELQKLRDDEHNLPLGNVAWIRFSTQQEAHVFARVVNHDKSRRMIQSSIEVVPEDIIWKNTSMNPKQRKAGAVVSWAITIGLIIIWAPILAFVALVSNVDSLCEQASFLAWLCTIPSAVLGIIKGILPAVAYALVFALLPPFLRFTLKRQGIVRNSDLELKLFSRYWLFQIIHGFLITTLASGLISALSDLGDTASSVPTLLAEKLPDASIFFLTLILAANLSGAAKTYSRVVPFVMYLLKGILGGKTPRKFYVSEHKMASFKFGVLWPPMCLIVTIVIVYSTIQPIITIVGLVCLGLLYVSYKYILGWCADQPDAMETGGLYYPKALNTVFTSLYLEEICLAGLFFLSTGTDGTSRTKSGLAGGVIMVIAIVATVAAQLYFQRRFPWETIVYTSSSLIGGTASTTKLALAPTVEEGDRDDEDGAGAHYGNTSGWHEKAFDHPALWKRQPLIWLAKDQFGVSDVEVARINSEEVEASNAHAELDQDAKLHLERNAPDESYYGGMTTAT